MDQDRQIRFAIPPFFFFASLLWGAYLGGRDLSPIFKPETAKEVFGVLAAAAVVLVPLGFLISTLSIMVLRALSFLTRKPTHEAVVDGPTLGRIWAQLHSTGSVDAQFSLYAVATFDHELLAPGVHTWIMRRWNSFNVAAHSVVALALAHVVAHFLSIPQMREWWTSTLALAALLVVAAFRAWRETMEMIVFQSNRQQGARRVVRGARKLEMGKE